MALSGIIKYRAKGNCFASCVVNGLQLQGDKNLAGSFPEAKIFSPNILYDSDEAKEFAPTLAYLVKNSYKIKLIDPTVHNNNYWGKALSQIPSANILQRNYKKKDINQLTREGYSVIFSTWSADANSNLLDPHAILAHRKKLYDPQNRILWNKPSNVDKYIARNTAQGSQQFLIAFMKELTDDDKPYALKEHVGYELAMLFRAKRTVELFDKQGMGNICSIARDSIYIHARLLNEFFWKSKYRGINIELFGGTPVAVLSDEERESLNSHVAHLSQNRVYPVHSIDLAENAIQIADKIIDHWKDWMKNADPAIKPILQEIWDEAEAAAKDVDLKIKKISKKHKQNV